MKPNKKKADKNSNETFIMRKTPNEIAKPDILKKIEMIENQKKKEKIIANDLSKIKIWVPESENNINAKPHKNQKKKTVKKSFKFYFFFFFIFFL